MITLFDSDDKAYQAWLAANPSGYVVNTPRGISTSYMVLHRAGCPKISSYNEMAKEGGFTERQYIKVCGESVSELRDWVAEHGRPDRTFTNECTFCAP